jgi:hypothetical protein
MAIQNAIVLVAVVAAVGVLVESAKNRIAFLQWGLVGAAAAWVAWTAWKAEAKAEALRKETKTLMPKESRFAGSFAPIDADMYGLRLPGPYKARAIPTPHLLRRPKPFLRALRRVLRIADMTGSTAAATRLVGALEDFFSRADRVIVDPLAPMAFGTLRDARAAALAALQELGFAVPEVRAGPVRAAEAAVIAETTRTMRSLRDRLIASSGDRNAAFARSVAVAAEAAGCDARPLPFDDFSDIAQRTVHV